MKKRQTINSDSFQTIFKNKPILLAELASSLTHKDKNIYLNNITTDINNNDKLQYIVTMPKDKIIIIKDKYNNKNITINLKKKK